VTQAAHLRHVVALSLVVVFVTLIDSLRFWEQNSNMHTSKLAHLAQEFICAPASQGYVERVFFSSAVMRVFPKLNQEILQQTWFPFDSPSLLNPDLTADCSFTCTVNNSVSRTVNKC